MFERKITRKIYGPTRTADGHWRIVEVRYLGYVCEAGSEMTGK
jgi:hypothetical protein